MVACGGGLEMGIGKVVWRGGGGVGRTRKVWNGVVLLKKQNVKVGA